MVKVIGGTIDDEDETAFVCEHDGKACDLGPCVKAKACVGLKCPVDDTICGVAKCLSAGKCTAKAVANVKPTETVKPANQQPKSACHTGFYKVGTVNDMTLWVGKEATFRGIKHAPGSYDSFALVISLLGQSSFRDAAGTAVVLNTQAQQLFPEDALRNQPIPMIAVDWPDFEAPLLSSFWWNELANGLRSVKGDVLVYCMGGHGRTGTAATILSCLLGIVPEDRCPVDWLRSVYCKQVVESDEQIDYIECMTGRAVTSEAHSAFAFYDAAESKQWWEREGAISGGRA